MDDQHFDQLVRSLTSGSSRRRVFVRMANGLLAIVPFALDGDDAAAKKKRKKKKKKKKARSQPCVPESPDATCAGRCGTVSNLCFQPVVCTCPGSQSCLSNASCATVCADIGDCAGDCLCASFLSTEGAKHCVEMGSCTSIPRVCTSTADCPLGQVCQDTTCGDGGTHENRCRPLCNS